VTSQYGRSSSAAAGDPVVGAFPPGPDAAARGGPVEDDLRRDAFRLRPRVDPCDELVFRDIGPAGAQNIARIDENCEAQGVLRLYEYREVHIFVGEANERAHQDGIGPGIAATRFSRGKGLETARP